MSEIKITIVTPKGDETFNDPNEGLQAYLEMVKKNPDQRDCTELSIREEDEKDE